jgi:hypothetical protein
VGGAPDSRIKRGLAPSLVGLLVSAPAALAASPATPAPDAQSARLLTGAAEVCFDTHVQTPDPAGFALAGYASAAAPLVPTAAQVVSDDPRCVRLTFGPGLDLGGFTLLTAAGNAVQDLAGRASVPGARPLQGSYASPRRGQTTGPQLVETSVDATLNTITFTYSRPLDTAAPVDPTQFGFYTASGPQVFGDGATPAVVSGRQVTIRFVAGTSVLDAVRTFALRGAVRSHTQLLPSAQDVLGATTGRPDLVDVKRVEVLPGVYELTYDTVVVATTSTIPQCVAVLEDGTRIPAVSFARPSQHGQIVRVAFGMFAAANDNKIARIADEGGCVVNQTASTTSTLAAYGVRTLNQSPGFTDGPDLEGVDLDAGSGLATFRFDQPLDPSTAFSDRFSLVHGDGQLSSGGIKISTVTPTREVVMQFTNAAVAGAVGAAVTPGAIADFLGAPSPLGAVARTVPEPRVDAVTQPQAPATLAPAPAPAPIPPAILAPQSPNTSRPAWPTASARLGRRSGGRRYVALRVRGTERWTRVVIGMWNRKGRYFKAIERTVPANRRFIVDQDVPRRTRGVVVAVKKVF